MPRPPSLRSCKGNPLSQTFSVRKSALNRVVMPFFRLLRTPHRSIFLFPGFCALHTFGICEKTSGGCMHRKLLFVCLASLFVFQHEGMAAVKGGQSQIKGRLSDSQGNPLPNTKIVFREVGKGDNHEAT